MRQNVGMTRRLRPSTRIAALLIVVGLVLVGCGKDEEKAAPEPAAPKASEQTAVPVPSGVTLTEYGTELEFGETAVVAYSPNSKKRTILELTVKSVKNVPISTFKAYRLDERARKSTPYFVKVTVKNVGQGDVGRAPIPLYLADDRTPPFLINPSTFESIPMANCPSPRLPATFGPGESMDACLVYLVPDGGKITAMSFRAVQEFAPILWSGEVAATNPAKKAS